MRKKEIKTIQRYFEVLEGYLEDLFESQRTKLETEIGYDLCAYQIKTKYRIENLFVFLRKICGITNNEKIIIYLKNQNKKWEKNAEKNAKCTAINKKIFTKRYVENILEEHCEILLFQLEQHIVDFAYLEYVLLTTLYENVYEYAALIEQKLILNYTKNIIKEKAITKRLKKKKTQNNLNK